MASPSQRLSIGPWPGGLTLQAKEAEKDATGSQQYLIECLNMDVTDEGFLISRAGVQRVGVKNTHYTDSNRECKVLGSVFENGNIYAVMGIQVSGTSTKIYLTANGYDLYYYGSLTGLISSVQQYNNVIYLTREDADSGYSIANNFFTWPAATPNASATVSTMPRGDKSFVFKDRLFIVQKSVSQVNFSAPADPTDYTTDSGGGYFIVDPANDVGAQIMDIVLTNETFYIFKRNSTYLFAYDANPNDDGILRLINATLGAFSATTWENDIYVINARGVYRIVNGVFIRLDEQLNLAYNADLASIINPEDLNKPRFIHASAGRLLVGQFSNDVLNKFGWNFVSMNLQNGAWSGYKYKTDGTAPGGQGVTAQQDDKWGVEIYPSVNGDYFSRVSTSKGAKDYTLDGTASDTTEKRYIPKFSVKTVPYNGQFSSVFKKLHRLMIRSYYYYLNPPTPADVSLNLNYDYSTTTKKAVSTWNLSSLWETGREQTEVAIPTKQQRFRNLTVQVTGQGEEVTGTVYSIPPNTTRTEPEYELLITGIELDVSFPRGNSPK